MHTDIVLGSLHLAGVKRIGKTHIHLATAFDYSSQDLSLRIEPSILLLDRARLDVGGVLNFMGEGAVDLSVDGSGHDFTILQLFLSDKGLRNFEKGDLYARGTIRNNSLRGMPVADLSFGLEEVRMLIPGTNKYIEDLNLSGYLNTGSKADLSNALLRIDTLYAGLPGGYLHAKLQVNNMREPEFDVDWYLKADVTGLGELFRFEVLDLLGGSAESKLKIRDGYCQPDSDYLTAEYFEAMLDCDSVSVAIPGAVHFNSISGRIFHRDGITSFFDLAARSGDSDFLLNGTIRNSMYLLLGIDTLITGELKIRSDIFDLPGFLDFVPGLRKAFPYRIRDIDLEVAVSTSTERFRDMRPNPSITFNIGNLDACVDGLTPPLSISRGNFDLHHRDDRVYLAFEDFDIDIQGSRVEADLELLSPEKRRTYMIMELRVQDLVPGDIIPVEDTDTIPELLTGILNGSFELELHFPQDTTQALKKLDMKRADFRYENLKDTFEVEGLYLLAEDIRFDSDAVDNPLAALSSEMSIKSRKALFRDMEWKGLEHEVSVSNGRYTVHPITSEIFGKRGDGLYILDPFAEHPNYRFRYRVEQYNVQDLMGSFGADTMLEGKLDLYIDLSVLDSGEGELVSGLNGEIQLRGRDLVLYGIELDKLIRRFERSQKFNLVDLGAVVLAGPAGLAISKGGTYANILVSDYSASSGIRELASDWKVIDGMILLEDVAFSTDENRVAAKGWIDLESDSLDIMFAVVDPNGCSIIEQYIHGLITEPEREQIRFLETIIAPVTNLFQSALGRECEVFYDGRVSAAGK
jgi:AsmA protein